MFSCIPGGFSRHLENGLDAAQLVDFSPVLPPVVCVFFFFYFFGNPSVPFLLWHRWGDTWKMNLLLKWPVRCHVRGREGL